MAKFYGVIGFVEYKEGAPGVMREETYVEHPYKGDVLRNIRKWEKTDNLNDDLLINNQISIVGDPYAFEHFFAMRYVHWMGANWVITNVEVRRPRLLLTLGGLYHGETPETSDRT